MTRELSAKVRGGSMALLFVVAAAGAAQAQMTAVITVPGINGGSTSVKGAVDVEAFNLGFQAAKSGIGCSEASFIKGVNVDSVALAMMVGAPSNGPIVLDVLAGGEGKPQPIYRVAFEDATVTGLQQAGSSAGASESLSVRFARAAITAWRTSADGSVGAPTQTTVVCR